MGAVAINRKRSDESLNLNQYSPYLQPSKKRRFGIMSNKPASRISRYPDPKASLRREIHAPSRAILRYGSPNHYLDHGHFLGRNYENAKRRALDALRFFTKDKEIIDLGDETEEAVSEDSSIEIVDCELVEEEEKKTPSDVNNNLRVDTMLDSLSLVRKETTDASSLQAYKKLLQSAESRNPKLEALRFEILFTEKRFSQLRQSRPKPVEKPLKKVPDEPFIPLTEEEEAEVYRAFSGKNRRKILVTHANSNIDITGEVLQCLTPSSWLNDEVINVYLELLKERETREPKKYLKCHFFNTFFYKKLVSDSGYNFKAVRRWTTQRKLGYALIDCDMIFVPIHRGVHWTLAVINNRDQKFLYLDSLNGIDSKILNALAKYLGDEAKEKSGKDINVSSWDMEFVEDLPQQQNGYVTVVEFAMYVNRGGAYVAQIVGGEKMGAELT